MTNFNERTNTLLYEKYISHFILQRVDVGCVWEVSWRRGQTVILTQSSSDHSSTSSSSWQGCSTVGHWGPQALSLQADSHSGILSPNWLQLELELNWFKPSVSWLYFYLTSTCFRLFTQVHLLIDGSVEGQYTTLWRKNTRSVVVSVLVCDIKVREFALQSPYYALFRTNTLGNGMNTLILSAIG